MNSKEILPKGSKIKYHTGWVWDVEDNNVIRYSPTGQTSNLLYHDRREYIVIQKGQKKQKINDLDEKLQNIIMEIEAYGINPVPMKFDEATFMEQIKQAFIDDGWSQEPRQYDQHGNLKINGQEFYDRFEEEVTKMSVQGGLLDGFGNIKHEETLKLMVRAAKRAAGIE